MINNLFSIPTSANGNQDVQVNLRTMIPITLKFLINFLADSIPTCNFLKLRIKFHIGYRLIHHHSSFKYSIHTQIQHIKIKVFVFFMILTSVAIKITTQIQRHQSL